MHAFNTTPLVAVVTASTLLSGAAYAQPAQMVPVSNLPACGSDAGQTLASINIAVPPIGSSAEVEVGQSMVSAIRATPRIASLTLDKDASFGGRYGLRKLTGTVSAGPLVRGHVNYYKPVRSDLYFDGSSKSNTWPHPFVELDVISTDPLQLKAIVFFDESDHGRSYVLENPAVTITQCVSMGQDSFRRELVYTGVSKGTVSLQYREFKDDYARPAFSQELHYDLSEGDEIGFRGARFKIVKATNASVKYVVLKPLE